MDENLRALIDESMAILATNGIELLAVLVSASAAFFTWVSATSQMNASRLEELRRQLTYVDETIENFRRQTSRFASELTRAAREGPNGPVEEDFQAIKGERAHNVWLSGSELQDKLEELSRTHLLPDRFDKKLRTVMTKLDTVQKNLYGLHVDETWDMHPEYVPQDYTQADADKERQEAVRQLEAGSTRHLSEAVEGLLGEGEAHRQALRKKIREVASRAYPEGFRGWLRSKLL